MANEERFHMYEGRHDFLAEGLMVPFVNQTNNNRLQMFNSHIGQAIQVDQSEPPFVFTGFENQVGTYSTGYNYLDGEWMVLKRIDKNQFSYILIIQNVNTSEYDIVYRNEAENLTEHFGHKNMNYRIDSLKAGDIIEDEILYHDQNYDENMNLQYGKNLNVAYLAYKGFTNEDAFVISESAAHKMGSWFIEKINININPNDILLNIYGDNDNYKAFPNIGETVKDGILLTSRRIAYNDINKLKDKLLDKYIEGDTRKYTHNNAMLIDMEIFCNSDMDKLSSEPYYHQLSVEYDNLKRYQAEVVQYLKPIVSNRNSKFTNELRTFYNRIASYNDPLSEFENNGRRFDNIIMEFTLMYKKPLVKGSKCTQRMGGKGVVSLILPDDQMPVISSTIEGDPIRKDTKIEMRADIITNPLGIVNRLNPSQLNEQTVNFIMKITRYRMEEMEYDVAFNYFLSVIEEMDDIKENYNTYKDIYESFESEEEKKDFVNSIIVDGAFIKEEPFWRNVNMFRLKEISKKFNIGPVSVNVDGKPIRNKMVIAEVYYIRLKHEPSHKVSARSVDNNNMSDLPTKTRDNKNSTSIISNTPIKMGEMEVTNTGIVGSLAPIEKLLDQYSNNSEDRKDFITHQLTDNPYEIKSSGKSGSIGSNNKILNSYFSSLGINVIKNEDIAELDGFMKDLSVFELESMLDEYQKDPESFNPMEYLRSNKDK